MNFQTKDSRLKLQNGFDVSGVTTSSKLFVGGDVSTSVFILDCSGQAYIGTPLVKIGVEAGLSGQNSEGIGIGFRSAYCNQGTQSIAIGSYAGYTNQDSSSIAIGRFAGYTSQRSEAIAIGSYAGAFTQGYNAISIGNQAGRINQRENAIAIGQNAGATGQGTQSIAIGAQAGASNQHNNTIILNASGVSLNSTQVNSTFIRPIRYDISGIENNILRYNTSSFETINDIYDWYNYSTSSRTLANTTSYQNIFNFGALQNLPAGVYEGQIIFMVDGLSAVSRMPRYICNITGATVFGYSHIKVFFGSDAYTSSVDYTTIVNHNYSLNIFWQAQNSAQLRCLIDLSFYIGQTSTVNPQISFTVGPGTSAVILPAAFFRVRRLGGNLIRPAAGYWSN